MPRCDFDPTLTNVFAGAFDDAFNLLTIANPFYATLGSQANLRFQLANWFLVNSQLVEHGRSHLTAAAVVAFGSKEQQRHPLGTAITECAEQLRLQYLVPNGVGAAFGNAQACNST